MPNSVKLRHQPPSSSPKMLPGVSEDLMSLEDFLAESEKTPNRVREKAMVAIVVEGGREGGREREAMVAIVVVSVGGRKGGRDTALNLPSLM